MVPPAAAPSLQPNPLLCLNTSIHHCGHAHLSTNPSFSFPPQPIRLCKYRKRATAFPQCRVCDEIRFQFASRWVSERVSEWVSEWVSEGLGELCACVCNRTWVTISYPAGRHILLHSHIHTDVHTHIHTHRSIRTTHTYKHANIHTYIPTDLLI